MGRLLITAACIAALVAGCSLGFVATESVRFDAAFVSRMQALEEPRETQLHGTIRGVNAETTSLQIEITNPYSSSAETLLLEITTTPETIMLILDPMWGDIAKVPTEPSARSASFDAFTPGSPVTVRVTRTPGPLRAVAIFSENL